MMSSGSSIKKRKASDTHHDVAINSGGNLSQQMDAMMQIMLRMEEKCNRLEAKCNSLENIVKEQVESLHTKIDGTVKQQHNSLENILERNTQSIKEQVDSLGSKIDNKFKQNEYNSMILKNQSWKYSAPVRSMEHWMNEYENDNIDAKYLSETSNKLREMTESLRRGKFPNKDYKMKGVSLDFDDEDSIFDDDILFGTGVNNNILPHWREFAAALKQFTPAFGVLPNGCESFFRLVNVQLNAETIQLLKEALMNKPFQELRIMNTMGYAGFAQRDRGMVVDAIIALARSNKHLRKLYMEGNPVNRGQIGELCSVVRNHPSILDLDLRNCFDNGLHDGLGDEMMTSLLTNGDIRLERLVMSCNNITSSVTALVSDFLATDPPLKKLDLSQNDLNDNDAALLANALRSNKLLRMLHLDFTDITNVGGESFRLALNDDSTLNAVSDSNHSCTVYLSNVRSSWNNGMNYEFMNDLDRAKKSNRAHKIYKLLSSRHKSMSNAQHFGDTDVNVLPHMVEAVQKYAEPDTDYTGYVAGIPLLPALSIVYEVMRKWDKVFPVYDTEK
jgi:hypothetical protein